MKYPNSIFIDDDILNMLRGITNRDLTCAMEMRKCKDDYDTTMASKRSLVGLKDVYVSVLDEVIGSNSFPEDLFHEYLFVEIPCYISSDFMVYIDISPMEFTHSQLQNIEAFIIAESENRTDAELSRACYRYMCLIGGGYKVCSTTRGDVISDYMVTHQELMKISEYNSMYTRHTKKCEKWITQLELRRKLNNDYSKYKAAWEESKVEYWQVWGRLGGMPPEGVHMGSLLLELRNGNLSKQIRLERLEHESITRSSRAVKHVRTHEGNMKADTKRFTAKQLKKYIDGIVKNSERVSNNRETPKYVLPIMRRDVTDIVRSMEHEDDFNRKLRYTVVGVLPISFGEWTQMRVWVSTRCHRNAVSALRHKLFKQTTSPTCVSCTSCYRHEYGYTVVAIKGGAGLGCLNCFSYCGSKRAPGAKLASDNQIAHDFEFKMSRGGKCVDCNFGICTIDDAFMLEYDHQYPDDKSETIYNMMIEDRDFVEIDAERMKCELRCKACHKIRTHRQWGLPGGHPEKISISKKRKL